MFITSFFLEFDASVFKAFYFIHSNIFQADRIQRSYLNRLLAANEGSKQKAIVSFYRDDSDTVFLTIHVK